MAAALLIGPTALAQVPAETPEQVPGQPPGQAPVPQPRSASQAPPPQCDKLPGGNAPIDRIAALPTGLSIRNLELTYFGKRLADLTEEDFTAIAKLSDACTKSDREITFARLARFEDLVKEAQQSYANIREWILSMMEEMRDMTPGQQASRRLQEMWVEMDKRSTEMLRADLQGLAAAIETRKRELEASIPLAPRPGPPPPPPPSPGPVLERRQGAAEALRSRSGERVLERERSPAPVIAPTPVPAPPAPPQVGAPAQDGVRPRSTDIAP
jgi:hypothetical protein